jgi:glutathione synthase/RimK-type ligase-like ATP-grasp enzyme
VYQEKVEKEFDVRVTVVGERLFAAKIEAPGLPPGIPDWRAAPVDELLHSCHELPLEIQEQCVGLVKELNLDFGAIDLAYSERTGYSFLEINANGQWAWLETELGFPIARAIADRLVEGASGFRP